MPPTLTERFFGRMAAIGFPFQIYLDVVVAGQVDRDALALALHRTVADHPRLRVRLAVARGKLRRHVVAPSSVNAGALVREHATVADLEARRGDPLDLATTGPLRIERHASPDATRLVLVAQHAMTDARGLLAIYERLAAHYAEATGGPPAPALPAPTDARRRRLLDDASLSLRLAVAGSVLSPFREMIPGLRSRPAARFHDAPTAEGSTMQVRHLAIPAAQLPLLLRAGARRTASLNDLLVASIVVAAHEAWPQADDTPVAVDVPVDLRTGAADVSDQAGPFRFTIPARVARDFDATLAEVCRRTREARTRTPSIVQSFGTAIPSRLPLGAFDAGVGGFIRANPTGGDSLCVSNVGTLTGRLPDFGPHALRDTFTYANAPGLRLMVIPSPRGLQLSVSYFSPLVADHQVARVIAGVEARLDALAGTTDPTRSPTEH